MATRTRAYRALGAEGWIGIHWPRELGGRGLSSLHTLACEERFGYHWLPLSGYLLSVKTIGNALLRFASARAPGAPRSRGRGRTIAVLPGLLRARRRLGSRLAAHPRTPGRRPVRRQRPQDLDLERRLRATGSTWRSAPTPTASATAASRCSWPTSTRPGSPSVRTTRWAAERSASSSSTRSRSRPSSWSASCTAAGGC